MYTYAAVLITENGHVLQDLVCVVIVYSEQFRLELSKKMEIVVISKNNNIYITM